jgi:hypothetical protein
VNFFSVCEIVQAAREEAKRAEEKRVEDLEAYKRELVNI